MAGQAYGQILAIGGPGVRLPAKHPFQVVAFAQHLGFAALHRAGAQVTQTAHKHDGLAIRREAVAGEVFARFFVPGGDLAIARHHVQAAATLIGDLVVENAVVIQPGRARIRAHVGGQAARGPTTFGGQEQVAPGDHNAPLAVGRHRPATKAGGDGLGDVGIASAIGRGRNVQRSGGARFGLQRPDGTVLLKGRRLAVGTHREEPDGAIAKVGEHARLAAIGIHRPHVGRAGAVADKEHATRAVDREVVYCLIGGELLEVAERRTAIRHPDLAGVGTTVARLAPVAGAAAARHVDLALRPRRGVIEHLQEVGGVRHQVAPGAQGEHIQAAKGVGVAINHGAIRADGGGVFVTAFPA